MMRPVILWMMSLLVVAAIPCPARDPLRVTRLGGEPAWRVIDCGATPVARVSLQHDGNALHIEYRVTDPSPLKNRGQDPLHHFKEGDAVDLNLGPWRENPAGPADGDLRVLFVPLKPKPVAVLYQQIAADATPRERVVFSSPVREVVFAGVRMLTEADVKFEPTETGYRCVARIPFAVLGIDLTSSTKYRGDLGVLRSNDGGLVTAGRCQLFDRLNTTVSDIPTEVELRPQHWGPLTLE